MLANYLKMQKHIQEGMVPSAHTGAGELSVPISQTRKTSRFVGNWVE